jgi:hypothetical protein
MRRHRIDDEMIEHKCEGFLWIVRQYGGGFTELNDVAMIAV